VDAGEEVADRIGNHRQFSLLRAAPLSGTAEPTLPGVDEATHRLCQVGGPGVTVGRRNHPGQMGRVRPSQVSVEVQRTR